MKKGSKEILGRISITVFSNVISLIASSLIIMIVPKFLSTEQYGFFQLYIFYTGYIGFANFGWPEGIMLRYGGCDYDALDKPGLKRQLGLFSQIAAILGAVICILAILTSNVEKQWIWIGVGLCIVVYLPRAFMQVLLHMTNRTREYAKGIMLEKAVYLLGVVALLIAGVRDYYWLIVAELLGRAVARVYISVQCSDILRAQFVSLRTQLSEIRENIRVGFKLMLANLVGLFMVGIVRQSIEMKWDVETFAKVSLTLSVSNVLMVFIRAISVVLFPTLKSMKQEKLPAVYRTLRTGLMVVLFGMLIVYFPAKVILSAWLPKYAESLKYMALLFPMCVFESKMSMLIETYMKTLRMERQLLSINLISVALSFLLSWITVFVMNNLELAVLSILILVMIRCVLAEMLVAPKLGLKVLKDILTEIALVCAFVFFSWEIGGVRGFVFYILVYAVYLLLNRGDVRALFQRIRANGIE